MKNEKCELCDNSHFDLYQSSNSSGYIQSRLLCPTCAVTVSKLGFILIKLNSKPISHTTTMPKLSHEVVDEAEYQEGCYMLALYGVNDVGNTDPMSWEEVNYYFLACSDYIIRQGYVPFCPNDDLKKLFHAVRVELWQLEDVPKLVKEFRK